MKNKVQALLSISITSFLLVWSFRRISFDAVLTTLGDLHLSWLLVGLFTFPLSFSIRAWRWGVLLKGQPNPGTFHIRHAAVFIGFAANLILPANAGELVRSGILKKMAGISLSSCLGSLLAARLLDATVAFVFLLLPLFIKVDFNHHFPSGLPILGLGLILLALFSIFYLSTRYSKRTVSYIKTTLKAIGFTKFSESMASRVERILNGLSIFQSPKDLAIAMLQTIAIWTVSGVTFWTTLMAFEIYTPGFSGALFVQSLESMATIIPSTPGHLGAFEAAIRLALDFYSISPDLIIAYTLVLRAIMNGSVLLIGILFFLNLGLSRAELMGAKAEE